MRPDRATFRCIGILPGTHEDPRTAPARHSTTHACASDHSTAASPGGDLYHFPRKLDLISAPVSPTQAATRWSTMQTTRRGSRKRFHTAYRGIHAAFGVETATALMLGWSRAWRCGRARRPSPPTPRPSRPEATGESEGTNDHRRTLDASPHASGRPSHSAFDGGGPLQARTRPRRTGERPSMGVTIGTDSRPLVETKIT